MLKRKQRTATLLLLIICLNLTLNASASDFTKDSSRAATDSLTLGTVEECAEETRKAPSIKLNSTASRYVQQYIQKNEKDLSEIESRSERIFAIIEKIFNEHGVPAELKYLAVIESRLKSNALSRVGARGLWQLMPATARELGLKVNGKTDERTNIYKSTAAAAKYLKELYRQFDDWLLVIAAYNSGPGYVINAIRKSGSRNFWKIQHLLPAETRSHVKRYIGTHCFFQEENSITVLTRQEVIEHEKAVKIFQAALQEDALAGTTARSEE